MATISKHKSVSVVGIAWFTIWLYVGTQSLDTLISTKAVSYLLPLLIVTWILLLFFVPYLIRLILGLFLDDPIVVIDTIRSKDANNYSHDNPQNIQIEDPLFNFLKNCNELSELDLTEKNQATSLNNNLSEICTALNKFMCKELSLAPDELHCCIKAFCIKDKSQHILTIGRSKPDDGRSPNIGVGFAKPIAQSSVSSALLGGKDACDREWPKLNGFICNDLDKVRLTDRNKDGFVCGNRKNAERWYNSTFVLPLYNISKGLHNNNEEAVTGFLAFDSPKPDAFRNLPDVGDYFLEKKLKEYSKDLENSLLYKDGLELAKTLSKTLQSILDRHYAKNSTEFEPIPFVTQIIFVPTKILDHIVVLNIKQ